MGETRARAVFDWSGLSPSGHQVGIWDPSGQLLASTTVFPSDPKSGNFFRFHPLNTPLTLSVANGYRVAALHTNGYLYGFNDPGRRPWGWTADTRIRFGKPKYIVSDTLQYPTSGYWGGYGLFGGNLMLRDPVPEPALIRLPFLLGLGGIGAWYRRRRTA